MKTFVVEIIEHCGNRCISVSGFVLSSELKAIKEKLGDISKLPIGKKIKVKV